MKCVAVVAEVTVTFWMGVAVAYFAVIALGLSLGRYLGERFRRNDDGGRQVDPGSAPKPIGPTHALEFPPLGSAFDRALLPGAFEEPVRERVA
jgi:hypothetical protein